MGVPIWWLTKKQQKNLILPLLTPGSTTLWSWSTPLRPVPRRIRAARLCGVLRARANRRGGQGGPGRRRRRRRGRLRWRRRRRGPRQRRRRRWSRVPYVKETLRNVKVLVFILFLFLIPFASNKGSVFQLRAERNGMVLALEWYTVYSRCRYLSKNAKNVEFPHSLNSLITCSCSRPPHVRASSRRRAPPRMTRIGPASLCRGPPRRTFQGRRTWGQPCPRNGSRGCPHRPPAKGTGEYGKLCIWPLKWYQSMFCFFLEAPIYLLKILWNFGLYWKVNILCLLQDQMVFRKIISI